MATPHVSGAAALYKAHRPLATAAEVKSAILQSVTPTASLVGVTSTSGRLNAAAMLACVPNGAGNGAVTCPTFTCSCDGSSGGSPACSCTGNTYCLAGTCKFCPSTW